MVELIEQNVWLLLAAFMVGGIVGWTTCGRVGTR